MKAKNTGENMLTNIRKCKQIVSYFNVVGDVVSSFKYGNGHIHQTYVVTTMTNLTSKRYILQRVNDFVFKNVESLMENIALVTSYNLKKVQEEGGNVEKECLRLVPTKDGKYFIKTDLGCFRMFYFIEGATTYQVVEKPEDFYESAVAFGKFQKRLDGFDASKLYEVIPAFHNTRKRYNDLMTAIAENKSGRAHLVQEEIAFAKSHESICDTIVDMLAGGTIPTRVTHNDTKLNNVMIDDITGKAAAVIDLDTLMPGSMLYDFGDSIRFGCNPCSEDEKDLTKVVFDINLFKVYAEGFLSVVKDTITQKEREYLALSAILMTLECGMRFLADYIDGDIYFHSTYAEQNLDRARTQFKLVSDMENRIDEMNDIISRI